MHRLAANLDCQTRSEEYLSSLHGYVVLSYLLLVAGMLCSPTCCWYRLCCVLLPVVCSGYVAFSYMLLVAGMLRSPTCCWYRVHCVLLPVVGTGYVAFSYLLLVPDMLCSPTCCWYRVCCVLLPVVVIGYAVFSYLLLVPVMYSTGVYDIRSRTSTPVSFGNFIIYSLSECAVRDFRLG